MRKAGVRIDVDSADERMQKKIRNAQLEKVPFMLIAGEEDQKANTVSFRYRNGEQKNGISISDAIAEVVAAVKDRKQI
jgi:threonyl-tRNA synthetase